MWSRQSDLPDMINDMQRCTCSGAAHSVVRPLLYLVRACDLSFHGYCIWFYPHYDIFGDHQYPAMKKQNWYKLVYQFAIIGILVFMGIRLLH